MPDNDTVEQCLAELREMFPNQWFEVKVSHHFNEFWYWIKVYGKPRQGQGAKSLAEAMAQVRQWKEQRDA